MFGRYNFKILSGFCVFCAIVVSIMSTTPIAQ
jgi:hypothetical protein